MTTVGGENRLSGGVAFSDCDTDESAVLSDD
jgi:hypothetical protein